MNQYHFGIRMYLPLMLLIRNLISGLSHLDFTLVGIYEELNLTITGGLYYVIL